MGGSDGDPGSEWLTWQVVDSAFPTGTFAHSWGLEAAWQQGEVADPDTLWEFLKASIQQAGYTTLPLLNAAYQNPADLEQLDGIADAFLLNPIANMASRVQGRTLTATAARVWPSDEIAVLKRRVEAIKAHVGPVSGTVFRAIGLSLGTAQRIALYGTARGVLTAGVRLGVVGSYEAQRLQHRCSPWLDAIAARCGALMPVDLAQTAPIIDLLQSAHDRLYSRLFQS